MSGPDMEFMGADGSRMGMPFALPSKEGDGLGIEYGVTRGLEYAEEETEELELYTETVSSQSLCPLTPLDALDIEDPRLLRAIDCGKGYSWGSFLTPEAPFMGLFLGEAFAVPVGYGAVCDLRTLFDALNSSNRCGRARMCVRS